MKVATTQPFSIVYSLFQHEYLGYLFGSYVVQVNGKGELTLLHQIVSTQNVREFSNGLDDNDFELVKAIDAIQQDTILKKFNPKKLAPLDFFLKIYDPQKGDKPLQEAITGYIEKLKVEILERLKTKDLYIMGADGNPAWMRIQWMPERAKVYFHFKRNEENTHYYPNIKYNGERLQIRNNNALLVCDEPAWLLIQDKLYHFDQSVDGKKIRPFLTKPQIIIPRTVEEQYFQRFVVPLVAAYEVYADGFEIKYETAELIPILHLTELTHTSNKVATLFEPTDDDDIIATDDTSQVVLELSFRYGNFLFKFDSFAANANVSLEKSGDSYLFHKVRRDIRVEKAKVLLLKGLGLDMLQGRKKMARSEAFEWLRTHHFTLKEAGIQIRQSAENGKQYFLGYSSIDISFEEGRDWFDIYAKVRFGEFEIPFIIIPEAWLTAYSELFAFAEYDPDSQQFLLRKHHLALVQEFAEDSLAKVIMSRKLEQLRDFKEIDENPLPEGFVGTLRPYQKAGYDWINFLNSYRFGGCLADDMGLG